MYWRIGERTFVEEQRGEERAKYGEQILKNLSVKLEDEFGSGFSYRQLAYARKFYRVYPIVNALRSQLNWSQYRLLISIDDDYKREYYELDIPELLTEIIKDLMMLEFLGLKREASYYEKDIESALITHLQYFDEPVSTLLAVRKGTYRRNRRYYSRNGGEN
jgi:hypothetical protein